MNIKATIVPFRQGTEEWNQHRARSCNSSELAVAMGLSPNMRRNDLIRCKATGIPFEHSDFVEQRVFAPGHETEAAARPLAEEVIGEDLYCSVFAAEVDGLLLSASLDGHTLLNEVTWEHKRANVALLNSLNSGVIPEQYHPQMEQGLMLTGATRCLFTASNGTRDSAVHIWYESRPELRAQIIPAWKQLMADIAAYVPTQESAPAPTGKAPETLPALRIEVTGEVTASNLVEFKETALAAIHSVNKDLQTDQDFADAAKAVKWCEDVESRLEAAKQHALSQTASIDALFKTMDDISAEARRVRLDLDKLVKARKDAIKAEIVRTAQIAFVNHIDDLNVSLGLAIIGRDADFGLVVKGLKTVTSMQNAVDTELARAKIAANEKAEKVRANLKAIQESGLVVHDTASLVLKAHDDLAAVLAQRKAAEVARQEAERERIRREEAARLEREAAQKAAAEKAEADRVERERAHAAQAEAQRIAREKEEAAAKAAEVERRAAAALAPPSPVASATSQTPTAPAIDTSARMSLGQINERIFPLSISAAGLSHLGFDSVEQVKAAKLYRASDFPAIKAAMVARIQAAV